MNAGDTRFPGTGTGKNPPEKSPGVPVAHPKPECNTGYAEPKPRDKAQAQVPGARPELDGDEGKLEYDPDPSP